MYLMEPGPIYLTYQPLRAGGLNNVPMFHRASAQRDYLSLL